MSTGADAKTMPVTAEYADNHERIFGERERPTGERRVYVSRCSKCDGVEHEPKALLFDCPRCSGKDCYGLVDASTAPTLSTDARTAPIMVDRFMEGAVATDGTDIGSRRKRADYMRATGAADKSDYGQGYGERVRAERDRAMAESTKRTVAEVARLDPRHIRKFIEEKK